MTKRENDASGKCFLLCVSALIDKTQRREGAEDWAGKEQCIGPRKRFFTASSAAGKGPQVMDLRFSVLARDRNFGKAMRRIRPRFAPLLEAFVKTELLTPIHQAILVGITDQENSDFFQEVPNGEGYFQVLAGVRVSGSDSDLAKQVLNTLRKAATACPFSKPDHDKIQAVFDAVEGQITR